jgi:NAD-dependent deacetylase
LCYSLPVNDALADGGRLAAEVRSRLSQVTRVFSFTGAGLSPVGGAPALCDASPDPFFEDPVAVWQWYDEHRARLAGVQAGAAHAALAALEKRMRHFALATECVDGLHRLAGSTHVLELRGNIWAVRCTRCGTRSVNRLVPIPQPPSCPVCTGLVRPGILWRGEHLPQDLLAGCFKALSSCQALILAGTSSLSHPAALFVAVARRAAAYVVEIAPARPVGALPVDALLVGRAEELLPQIVPA